jgi:hypothetical protein
LSGLVRVCDVILISLLHFSFDYALRAFDKSIPFTCFETIRLKPEEEPDYTMIAALAAVPLEVDDIDFDIDFKREEVAGIHVAVEVESLRV